MHKKSLLIMLPILISVNLFAQNSKNEKLSLFINKVMEIAEILPAINITIVDSTGTKYCKGFGYSDVENNIKANSQTNYYIASCTKPFNGLLLALLASDGKINLYKNINEYKPFINFKNNEVFKNITIMDLLSHQSGIENKYLTFKLAYTGEYTSNEILDLIENETQVIESGKEFEYTNFGYYLIDIILQRELGINWKDALNEKIFLPLNMSNTTSYISKLGINNLAIPYIGAVSTNLEQSRIYKTDKTMHAAGGLISNGEDIGKFLSLYLTTKHNKLFPQNLIEQTYKAQTTANHKGVKVFSGTGYGMGWRLGQFEQNEVVYHFGSFAGYFSHLSFIPHKNIGVAIFVNNSFGMPIANKISEYIYKLYMGIETDEDKLIEDIINTVNKYREMLVQFEQKNSERQWQFSLPKNKYEGTFYNKKFGVFDISLIKDEFIIKIANLESIGTPYPKDDCIRIELIPYSGSLIYFNIENDTVVSINYKDETFIKM